MNINLNNIILKKEKFIFENLVINNNVNKEFINIDYKNKFYLIEGLFFDTEWTKLLSNYFEIEKNNKYLFEFPLIENKVLHDIINKMDISFNKYIKDINYNNIFVPSLKKNYIENFNYTYDYFKLKLNLNNCKIYLDDKEYNNSFENLDFTKLLVKFHISTHGIWKYNNKYGFSWRIIKIFLKSSNTNNIDYFIDKNILKNNEIIEENYNCNSNDEDLNFKIPNFELEFDM